MNPICAAPFIQLHVKTEGQCGMCCLTENNLVEDEFKKDLDLPPDEFMTSAYMNDRRKKMLSGTLPPECKICSHKYLSNNYYDAYNQLVRDVPGLQDKLNDAIANQSWSSELLVTFDVRSMTCNFECRHCGPLNTSKKAQRYVNSDQFVDDFSKNLLKNTLVLNRKNYESALKIINESIENNRLVKIYFAGGEPTMASGHFELLEKLAIASEQQHMSVIYNSNLSIDEKKAIRWSEILPKFGFSAVLCSIDGLNEIGSYIRRGFKQEIFDRNIDLIKGKTTVISLDVTLTSLGLCYIDQMIDYAIKKKIIIRARYMVPSDGEFLLAAYLPLSMREKIIKIVNKKFELTSNEDKQYFGDLVTQVEKLKDVEILSLSDEKAVFDQKKYLHLYPNDIGFSDLFDQAKTYLDSISNKYHA